jgi:hypothetical protein
LTVASLLPVVVVGAVAAQQATATQEACVALLRSRDAIMYEDILDVIRRFIAAGGKPHVRHGRSPHARDERRLTWRRVRSAGVQTVVQLLSENYRGYAQMCNLVSAWMRAAGMSDESIARTVLDHLRTTVLRTFAPRKADAIFEREREAQLDRSIRSILSTPCADRMRGDESAGAGVARRDDQGA